MSLGYEAKTAHIYMKLRIGLVGLGDAWETRHRMALRSLSDRFEVRAVCVDVARRAEQVAGEFDAAAVDGFRALTSRADVDAVLLLSSHWYGSLPILAACSHGKAVYCATALEMDAAQAHSMKERVEESGVAFMAEFPRRHAPATLRLKELIATRLGAPHLLFCHTRMAAVGENGAPRHTGPPLNESNDLLELVDWCRYLVNTEPTCVTGQSHHGPNGRSDYQMLSLDFSAPDRPGTGPLAQISCGRYMPAAWSEAIAFHQPAALQVACARGIAFVDLPARLVWFDEAGRHVESLESERPVGEQLLTQFHRAVTSLVRKTENLEDAYQALRVVLSARRSFEEGKRVRIFDL